MSKKNDLIKSVKTSFEDYFCEYYLINKNVQSVNYYDMKRGNGCYAVVEYRGFLQYVSFYNRLPLADNTAVINTCFEFNSSGKKFVCYLDKYVVNVGWIGKQYGYSGVACGVIGVSLSLIALMLNFDRPLCKLITPKEHYEDVLQMIKAEEAPKKFVVICIVFGIVVSIVISVFFLFTGIGVTENYNIVERKYTFSPVVEYSLEDTEIAIIKGTTDDWGYSEYTDTAYAFKIDGEWVEFGVPSKEAQTIIETAIEKYDKDVSVYNTVNSIPLNE